jgi:hypothetical protein
MGDTRRLSASSLEERNSVGAGTFQPSFGFKDFHHAARLHPPPAVTQDGDLQFDGCNNPKFYFRNLGFFPKNCNGIAIFFLIFKIT